MPGPSAMAWSTKRYSSGASRNTWNTLRDSGSPIDTKTGSRLPSENPVTRSNLPSLKMNTFAGSASATWKSVRSSALRPGLANPEANFNASSSDVDRCVGRIPCRLRRSWRRSADKWGQWSRRPLPTDLLANYHAECLDRTICLLNQKYRSPLLNEDPSGTAALAFVADRRKVWRRRRRRGLLLHHQPTEAAAGHAPCTWPAHDDGDDPTHRNIEQPELVLTA